MTNADRKRFFELLRWLAKRYPVEGRPQLLPSGEELVDYFEALRDIPIEDLEGGARWHYGHSEYFPDRPATLRKSAQEWRRENPRPRQPPEASRRTSDLRETPRESRRGRQSAQGDPGVTVRQDPVAGLEGGRSGGKCMSAHLNTVTFV